MKAYKYLVFDADHTLISYKKDETDALKTLFQELSLNVTEEAIEWCHHLSEETWTENGLYDVNDPRIQREYHILYRAHVKGIFEKFFKKYPCDRDPESVGKRFLQLLCVGGNLFPEATETLSYLSDRSGGKYALFVATNGVTDVQTGRLKSIEKYFRKIYISERLGAIKPMRAFFEKMLSDAGAAVEDCLMIGDSLSSDILGAAQVGMDTCWFNTRGHENTTGVSPTYQIEKLSDLKKFL
ncbi:MAG: HAD-IA family hydrolase [Clostridia bacterium]|nr:HAD-IA family hydrolase [Clostridia bacterium]